MDSNSSSISSIPSSRSVLPDMPVSGKKVMEAGGSSGLASRRLSGPDGAGAGDFEMRIPNDMAMADLVIGHGGETIRSIQANSGARIWLSPRDDPSSEWSLYISGTKEHVQAAEQLINEVVRKAEAGGFGGSGLQLRRRAKPSLYIKTLFTKGKAGGSRLPPRTYSTGPDGARTSEIKLQFSNDMAGLIIGPGGQTLRSIQAKSGVRIRMWQRDDIANEGTFYISGKDEQIEAANQLIEKIIRDAAWD